MATDRSDFSCHFRFYRGIFRAQKAPNAAALVKLQLGNIGYTGDNKLSSAEEFAFYSPCFAYLKGYFNNGS